ncbi:MAG: hypothetical protein PHP73_04835 [Candidatus Omnitrophica bacterium]|nr:hypothetical protein [Candidatus Omnitrophota bacterium]
MVKRFFLPAILFIFVFLTSGCTVVRGTTGAIGGLTTGALEGGREGFKEDVEAINKANRWVEENQGFLSRADNWVKDNLW